MILFIISVVLLLLSFALTIWYDFVLNVIGRDLSALEKEIYGLVEIYLRGWLIISVIVLMYNHLIL